MAVGSFKLPTGAGGGTDISDADAIVGDVLTGKTFYAGTEPIKTGTMPNRGEVDTDITTKAQVVTIQDGYHDGNGIVQISATEQAKIIDGNIKDGITILGVTGTLAGGGGGYIINEYVADDTWVKPAGLVGAFVVCLGAGGGGGSGAKNNAGTAISGGRGGGGAAFASRFMLAAELASTENITIGVGGTGGASVSSVGSGNAGAAGTDTSFGTLVVANGGGGGVEGSTTINSIPNNGSISFCTPPQAPNSLSGMNGASHNLGTTTGGAGGTGFLTGAAASGGSGGGINAANTQRAGGTGGRTYKIDGSLSNVIAAGTTGGGNGTDGEPNQSLQLLWQYNVSSLLTNGGGSGGSGGGSATGADGGNGGHAGDYGAGGGGGGATQDTNSGAGGNGGGGLCIVMEIY